MNLQHTCSSPVLWVGLYSELFKCLLFTALKWRKPSDTQLMQCYCTCGYSCYAVKKIHTVVHQLLLLGRSYIKHRNVLCGHLFGGINSCSLPKFRNKALKKSSTSWRSTYKVASALNHTLICLNPEFPHKQVICETSEVILRVTFTQVKEEKSAQYIPVVY